MIEKVKTIDWAALENAYDTSSIELEKLLINAYHDKTSEAFNALTDYIHGNLIHQGTIYPSTVESVPFIIDLFPIAPPHSQISLIRFIAGVIDGLHQYGEVLSWDELKTLPQELSFLRTSSIHLSEKLDFFYGLYNHNSPEVRMVIPYLLGKYITIPEIISHESANSLLHRKIHDDAVSLYPQEINSLVRCSIIMLIGTLSESKPDAVSWLVDCHKREEHKQVKIFIALVLADCHQYEQALPTLTDALNDPLATDKLYNNQLLWFYGRLRFQVVHALCKFPFSYTDHLLNSFLNVIDSANEHTVEVEIVPILKFVFQNRKLETDVSKVSLTANERTILNRIYNHNLVGTNSGNAKLAFKQSLGIEDDPATWKVIISSDN